MSETIEMTKVNDGNREELFNAAYDGSYYTITGCDGALDEWVAGYRGLLDKTGIGTPTRFVTFQGADMNTHYGLTGENAYPDTLIFLMFPLDGLKVTKLATFKVVMGDRWFDDIVDNNRRIQDSASGIEG